jgi:hypothetical protein
MTFLIFLFLWVIFALLDPDPDSESGYGFTDPTESGSETLTKLVDDKGQIMKDKALCEQGIYRGDHVRVLQRSRALHCSTGTNMFESFNVPGLYIAVQVQIPLYIFTVFLTDLFYF